MGCVLEYDNLLIYSALDARGHGMLIRIIITANLSLILTLSDHMKLILGSNFSTHHTEITLEVVIDFQLIHQVLSKVGYFHEHS